MSEENEKKAAEKHKNSRSIKKQNRQEIAGFAKKKFFL